MLQSNLLLVMLPRPNVVALMPEAPQSIHDSSSWNKLLQCLSPQNEVLIWWVFFLKLQCWPINLRNASVKISLIKSLAGDTEDT